jgi:NAD(P)-dependent dehydrogenase (short-subunit alcohol dehydrogenase family)
MQIQDNVFIVTGGASGLGAATARMLVAQGGKVVLADVQAEAGQALAGELKAVFVKCDVTSEADGQAVVAAATALGTLRGLINCAGVAPAKTVGKDGPHPLDLFQRVVNINLIGTFNMARLAADAMSKTAATESGERGVIINTASVAAFDGQIGQAAYAASKAAVAGLTLPMARDLSRNGIRVMTIAPGIFETPMLMGMPEEVQDGARRHGAVPAAPRQAGRIRAAGAGHHRKHHAQWRNHPSGRRHPHAAEVSKIGVRSGKVQVSGRASGHELARRKTVASSAPMPDLTPCKVWCRIPE